MLTISFFLGGSVVGIISIFLINILIFNILIWTIPTNLNWSWGLYNHSLYQILISAVIVILSFSFIYNNLTVTINGKVSDNFVDSLHLSISMFCCLGYGEVLPSKYRIVSSCQSIIGICYIPLLAAYIWMYIQNKVNDVSLIEQKFKDDNAILRQNYELGILEVLEDQNAIENRNSKFKFENCKKCGSETIKIIVFINPRDWMPLKKFVCQCVCGNISKTKGNAIFAVQNWNKKNK